MSTAVAAAPIVLFSNSYTMGGMEEHVLQLARGLVKRGFRVAAICSPREGVRALRDGLTQAGVEVHCPAERQTSRIGVVHRMRELVRVLREYPGCVLHLHFSGHTGGEMLLVAAALAGARAIVRTDHNPPDPPVPQRDRVSVQLRDRCLARIICVSEQARRFHLDRLGRDARKCRVVHNGIELSQFLPTVSPRKVFETYGLDPAAPIIGTVSRLAEWSKGLPYFIDMAAEVASACPSARFLVVGDGPLRPELEKQALRLGIAEKVVFTGRVPELAPVLAAMRVFVLPSLREGGPITVLEAMAMARPVVATPVGMVPELMQDGRAGRLVAAAGDSAALARAVLDLLADHATAERLGQHAREVVSASYTLDAMVDGVAEVYREIS